MRFHPAQLQFELIQIGLNAVQTPSRRQPHAEFRAPATNDLLGLRHLISFVVSPLGAFGNTHAAMMYAGITTDGMKISPVIAIPRTTHTSTPKYRAMPAQTPATFCRRLSRYSVDVR